jgi:hypothetical protein
MAPVQFWTGVKPGERNASGIRYASYLRERGLDPVASLEMMRKWNNQLSEPLQDFEIINITKSAFTPETPYAFRDVKDKLIEEVRQQATTPDANLQKWKQELALKKMCFKDDLAKINWVDEVIKRTTKVELQRGDPPIYRIYFNDIPITLTAKEVLRPEGFITKFFSLFQEIPIFGAKNNWKFIIKFWTECAALSGIEVHSEEVSFAESIIASLKNCSMRDIEEKRDDVDLGSQEIFFDKARHCVWVPTLLLNRAMQNMNAKYSAEKLRVQLSNYVSGTSAKMRFGKTLVRCWPFKDLFFDEKIQEVEEAKKENDGKVL